MTDSNRRQALKAIVWSVPVVAVAVATPLAAASVQPTPGPRIPIGCEPAGKSLWAVTYNDGSTQTLHQGQVNRDKTLQALCRDKGPQS